MQVMSSAKQHRRYDSGYQKRKKKIIDELIESQKEVMEIFYLKECPKNKVFQVKNRYDNS